MNGTIRRLTDELREGHAITFDVLALVQRGKEPRTCSSGERSRRVRRAKLITLKRSIRSTTLASVRSKKNSQPRSGRSLNS